MKARYLALPILLALTRVPADSTACGGPDYADLGPVEPVDATLRMIVDPEGGEGAWGTSQRSELRFLYPFWKAHPTELEALWRFSYEQEAELPAPAIATFDAAIASARLDEAEREARRLIDLLYAMPPVPAAQHQALFWRLVEFLELRAYLQGMRGDQMQKALISSGPPDPAWPAPVGAAIAARRAHETKAPLPPAAGHPRGPSIEYWTLQEHMKTRIPDGWSDAIRQQVPAATWRDLMAEVDGWLTRHAGHPLGDLARLARIRIAFFRGDFATAWNQAMALYPSRRVRALAEMRYLLLQGQSPPVQPPLGDLELVTAFVDPDALPANRWETLWQRASQAPPSDVRTNLEERLLASAAKNAAPGKLPRSFPGVPRNPSPLWGKFRAIALLKAEQWDRAREEILSLADDGERAHLLAHLHVRTGHPELAAQMKEIDPRARLYLVRVLLDDAALRRLSAGPDLPGRTEAAFELAVRLAAAGKWSEALPLVQKARADRVALWKEAARVASGTGADRNLAWARFLDQHDGQLFSDGDPGFYRSASARQEALAVALPERVRVGEMLARSTERWLAVETYTHWLTSNPKAPNARTVLDEADKAYNRLINWGGADSFYFGREAKHTATVVELLRVGAEIRKRRRP